MVHEPVDSRQRHGLVGENLAPFAEGLVGRDEPVCWFCADRSFETAAHEYSSPLESLRYHRQGLPQLKKTPAVMAEVE
jgi:hypothetical protein